MKSKITHDQAATLVNCDLYRFDNSGGPVRLRPTSMCTADAPTYVWNNEMKLFILTEPGDQYTLAQLLNSLSAPVIAILWRDLSDEFNRVGIERDIKRRIGGFLLSIEAFVANMDPVMAEGYDWMEEQLNEHNFLVDDVKELH